MSFIQFLKYRSLGIHLVFILILYHFILIFLWVIKWYDLFWVWFIITAVHHIGLYLYFLSWQYTIYIREKGMTHLSINKNLETITTKLNDIKLDQEKLTKTLEGNAELIKTLNDSLK